MPMQSNTTKVMGTLLNRGAVVTTKPVLTTNFTVVPSPCSNMGDHKSPTPYSYEKEEVMAPTGTLTFRYWGNGALQGSDLSGVEALPGTAAYYLADASDPYNKALAKLVEQIKDSDLNVSTSVGEGRETLEMLEGIAKNSLKLKRRLSSAIKSGKPGQRLRDILKDGAATLNDLKAIGGGWLYFSLGVKPLLADIEALKAHVLSDKAEEVSFHVKARASSTAEVSSVDTWGSYPPPTYDSKVYLFCEDSKRVELGVDVSINNLHSFENWRAGIGLRPTLAWELLTLSFLVDYFIKIGEYLELMEAALYNNGISFKSGYVTETRKLSSLYTCEVTQVQGLAKYPYPEGKTILFTGRCDGGRRLLRKKRSLLTSFPTPRSPRLTIPKASTQLLNCAALLSQALSRGKP